jgi:hypothetical protein
MRKATSFERESVGKILVGREGTDMMFEGVGSGGGFLRTWIGVPLW